MTPKNTICLWFDKDALDAARFYAATFPHSAVTASAARRSVAGMRVMWVERPRRAPQCARGAGRVSRCVAATAFRAA